MKRKATLSNIDMDSERKRSKMSVVAKLFGNQADLKEEYHKMIRILPEEFDLNKMSQLKDYAKDVLSKPAQLYETQA